MRLQQDYALQVTTALPAAGANVASSSIDLTQQPGGEFEGFEVSVSIPATPSLTNGDTITATLQHSTDNATWSNIPQLEPLTVTGGGSGGAASSLTWRLPSSTNRYIQVVYAVQSGGGNNTSILATLAILT